MSVARNGFTPAVGRACSFEYGTHWLTGHITSQGPDRGTWWVYVGSAAHQMSGSALHPSGDRPPPPPPRPQRSRAAGASRPW
jgi:hypothetical protein